jgi:hypothetical protein
VAPFLEHVRYLYPDPYETDILLDYCAFQVQYPGQKVHWALLLQGCQGAGKSYFAEPLKLALGPWNVKEIAAKLLHEQFNGWQKNCQVIIVEEMMAQGRLDLMNTLKPQITQPWHQIREMYKPPYWIPNRFNFIFLTNHKDAIIINDTDRRYCVLASKAPPHPGGIERYYRPLFQWTKANGPALAHYLHHRPLAKFVPEAHAPMTEGKRMMIDESRTPLEDFIYKRVQASEWPFNVDIVSPDEIVEKVLPRFNLRSDPRAVGRAFANLGYTPLGYRRYGESKDGVRSQINLWAVRDGDRYSKMATAEIRTEWTMQGDSAFEPVNTINVVAATEPMSAGNIGQRVKRVKVQ